MANTILKTQELAERYAGEWVLLADPETDPTTGEVLGGRLLAHDPDQDAVYDAALKLKPKRSAFLCFKEMPEGTVLVL